MFVNRYLEKKDTDVFENKELQKKHERDKLDSILNKYSKKIVVQ